LFYLSIRLFPLSVSSPSWEEGKIGGESTQIMEKGRKIRGGPFKVVRSHIISEKDDGDVMDFFGHV
jgi:hypothetical protein